MEFSMEEIKMIAQAERMMDAGHPHVILGGKRMLTSEGIMEDFGLEQAQTINPQIHVAIIERAIKNLAMKQQINSISEKASKEEG